MKPIRLFATAAVVAGTLCSTAHAGPFILAGTDADDHGSFSSGANQDGWLFMQKAIENIAAAPSLTNGNKVVVSLGSNANAKAGLAAKSAFDRSALVGLGWTFKFVEGAAAISAYLAAPDAGIIMLDSGSNVSGGLSVAEQAALTGSAAALNSFVGGGGGLFSQANRYGWLSALLPSLTVNVASSTGITLTPAGNAAFPGLKNSDLSAGPYHANFTNVGLIPVLGLGVGANSSLNLIIGASGGSIIVPGVPEPATYAMLAAGLGIVGVVVRRRKQQS